MWPRCYSCENTKRLLNKKHAGCRAIQLPFLTHHAYFLMKLILKTGAQRSIWYNIAVGYGKNHWSRFADLDCERARACLWASAGTVMAQTCIRKGLNIWSMSRCSGACVTHKHTGLFDFHRNGLRIVEVLIMNYWASQTYDNRNVISTVYISARVFSVSVHIYSCLCVTGWAFWSEPHKPRQQNSGAGEELQRHLIVLSGWLFLLKKPFTCVSELFYWNLNIPKMIYDI